MPFFLSKREERELKDCAQIFFKGGNPAQDSELKEVWNKWWVVFSHFMLCIDARYGNFLHLPFSGGVMEQPMKTTACFQILQNEFRKKLDSEQKKALSGIKTRRR